MDLTDIHSSMSTGRRIVSRFRMPFVAIGFAALVAGIALPVGRWYRLAGLGLFAIGMVFYTRVGTPRGPAADIA